MNPTFWHDKKVFLTGHTGFKGSWLSLCLQQRGADVCGYSLAPDTPHHLFTHARVAEGMQSVIADIREADRVRSVMQEFQPDIVIHMAAQALVRPSYQTPIDTYHTNVMGTVHLLDAAYHTDSVRALVNVTSDKCYENREWLWGYREDEAMGGYDPYSNSKGCAELVTSAYRRSFFHEKNVGIASARAGNVIGGGDWACDRLVPDIIRACIAQESVKIRYPHAIRPWQHVLEPLSGYLLLAEKLYENPHHYSGGWNFGPFTHEAQPVEWIVKHLLRIWGGEIDYTLDENHHPHEAHYLRLDCSKAQTLLGWMPRWTLMQTLEKIVDWHQKARVHEDMRECTLQHINEFYGL